VAAQNGGRAGAACVAEHVHVVPVLILADLRTFADGQESPHVRLVADETETSAIALAEAGAEASLLESFLIDEKKMTLALLVSRVVSRLNGQKWLGAN
jgi:hypothetical protein